MHLLVVNEMQSSLECDKEKKNPEILITKNKTSNKSHTQTKRPRQHDIKRSY